MNNVIAIALEPLREDAVRVARQKAERMTGKIYAHLIMHQWDLNAAYPYPWGGTRRLSQEDYTQAKAKRQMAESLTVKDESKRTSLRIGDPYFVVADDNRAKDFCDFNMLEASLQFDNFVAKLTRKISDLSPVVEAQITEHGDLWQFSILTCTHKDGSTTKWKTKQIINVSKLGKLFNQWPTNQVK